MFFVYLWNLSFGIWNGTSLKDMSFRFMIFHLESLEDISAWPAVAMYCWRVKPTSEIRYVHGICSIKDDLNFAWGFLFPAAKPKKTSWDLVIFSFWEQKTHHPKITQNIPKTNSGDGEAWMIRPLCGMMLFQYGVLCWFQVIPESLPPIIKRSHPPIPPQVSLVFFLLSGELSSMFLFQEHDNIKK